MSLTLLSEQTGQSGDVHRDGRSSRATAPMSKPIASLAYIESAKTPLVKSHMAELRVKVWRNTTLPLTVQGNPKVT
jgi:hypothetical protein